MTTAMLAAKTASGTALRHSADCPVNDPSRPRVDLFGVPTDALGMSSTIDVVQRFLACGVPHQHVCLNAAKVVELDNNRDLVRAISQCDLISADGQSVVWASRFLGRPLPERVAGIDLFLGLLERAAADGTPVYLLGAKEEVVRRVVEVATQRWPGLVVAGSRCGYWAADEEHEVVADIAASGARLLFVALPSPRKELFLERHALALGVPFRMGVGGSFDVVAGVTRRAPGLAQRSGLEWLFRLLQEPRRMARRYLVGNAAFIRLTVRRRRGR